MRTKHNRRLLNAAQNGIIAVLVASALFLLLRTDLIPSAALDHMFSSVTPSASTAEHDSVSMQMPVQIETRTGSLCRAWPNETTAGDVFGDFGALLLEATGSAREQSAAGVEEFRRALENDNIFYDFTATLSLPLLDLWLGGSGDAPQVRARALVLSVSRDSTVTLYAWNEEEDSYLRWNTSVSAAGIFSAAERHSGESAEFAFLSEAPYDALAPYTLISQVRTTLHELSAATILEQQENALLTQLEFNVHSNSRYPESNGTEVIVQGSRTLRLSPDGTVRYDGGSETIPLLRVEHENDTATEKECTDAAWKLANALLAPHLGEASLYVLSVTVDRLGNGEVSFGLMIDGCPIVFEEHCAMQVTIEENVISAFSLHLRSYTLSERTATLLPILQATAAAQTGAPCTLFSGYYDDGSTVLSPTWLRR